MPAIDILGLNTTLDASGNIYPVRWVSSGASNADYDPIVVAYQNTGSVLIKLSGSFVVPADFNPAGPDPVFFFDWTTPAGGVGNAVWVIVYRAVGGQDAESLDQAPQQSLFIVSASPSTTRRRKVDGIPVSAVNLAPNDTVLFSFGIDRANGLNTLSNIAYLFNLRFVYVA